MGEGEGKCEGGKKERKKVIVEGEGGVEEGGGEGEDGVGEGGGGEQES